MRNNSSTPEKIEEKARLFAGKNDLKACEKADLKFEWKRKSDIPSTLLKSTSVPLLVSPAFHLRAALESDHMPDGAKKKLFSECIIKDGQVQPALLSSCQKELQQAEIAHPQKIIEMKNFAAECTTASLILSVAASAFFVAHNAYWDKKEYKRKIVRRAIELHQG